MSADLQGLHMRRREFITFAGAATVLPFAAMAQLKSIPRLGVLLYSNPQSDPQMAAIRRGLGDLGYVEGRNIIIEYRYAEGQLDRLPILAGQVVGLQPNVILAIGGDVSPIAKKVDERIPLVFVSSADPEQLGLVESLRRPGGIATGVTLLQDALASKRLELLKEAAPKISKVAFLWNPDHPDNEQRAAQLAPRPCRGWCRCRQPRQQPLDRLRHRGHARHHRPRPRGRTHGRRCGSQQRRHIHREGHRRAGSANRIPGVRSQPSVRRRARRTHVARPSRLGRSQAVRREGSWLKDSLAMAVGRPAIRGAPRS